jgi:ABC-2 type transport system ATP-binding protein
MALLGAKSFVREISVEGNQLRLYVEDGGQAMPELLRVLDSEQIGIKSMSLSEPTLDDVFLRQTGRSLRDTGAGDGARQGTEVAA